MGEYLNVENAPAALQTTELESALRRILESHPQMDMFAMMASFQRVLASNKQRRQWTDIHNRLETLFQAGMAVPLDGPMVGIPVAIRDSDYFRTISRLRGKERSAIAKLEWMATAWNATFADTGLWMGKTFESVDRAVVARLVRSDQDALDVYDPSITRIGRNFFRKPWNANLLQRLGLPVLSALWHLQPRPSLLNPEIFDTVLLPDNAAKEENVPYTATGGIFLANMGESVLPETKGKTVYQLNYRWPELLPVYPMTRLIDEIVQIGEGIYLGQLILATKRYSYLTIKIAGYTRPIGEEYVPERYYRPDYGYQNNGYFLMMDPAYAARIYADDVFPQLRPRKGEHGYVEMDG